ncbi:Nicotinate-nucleotide pyrophosphorylase [carboxylating] [Chlamydiales bacterium SCGC AB-751-O23]|jgi:nicotinate-nucleotide pyrophosphorylase (carboxylating)|nr:Nicotinate-nucleotide pyrophosphorylase [carboxylating] [Chlamydiales bacterium SCGC AB-751-O23]
MELQVVKNEVIKLIDIALSEDIGKGDITSEACIDDDASLTAKLILKQHGKLAGLPFLATIFQHVDPRITLDLYVREGSEHSAGTIIGSVSGPARGIMSAELVALNIVQHASGIASTTALYVEQVAGFPCEILDTRKTLPGLRYLEKYAVKIGGGHNHRYGLDEKFVINKKHLSFLAKTSKSPIKEAVKRARKYRPGINVEIAVESLDLIEEALAAEADIIMLERMTIPQVCQAVKIINHRARVEFKGCVTLETVLAFAQTGVDGISIKDLTHSIQDLDIRLKF